WSSMAVQVEVGLLLLANVYMTAGAATLFFDLGEVRALVPVGFRVVVVRDRVEARCFGGTAGHDSVCHAHDGGGVHAATQLCEDGTVRAEPAADSFAEDPPKVLFVFSIDAVTDSFLRIEIPILADHMPSRPYKDRRGWRDGMNSNIGR